jgi:hypothetical protein
MTNKIILGNSDDANASNGRETEGIKPNPKPNLFLGRLENEVDKSKFPDWDIIPPGQFINPRIKKQ